MNKLQGFYALKESGLPVVPWKTFKKGTKLDPEILWTIRSAVVRGDDLNLPRKIGVPAKEAEEFAEELLTELGAGDLVLYYPYFIAKKSGVIEVSTFRTVIEAVEADLWNLVTDNKKDVTIIFEGDDLRMIGKEDFLNQDEMLELVDYCLHIKKVFLNETAQGNSIFVEWSYGYQSDIHKNIVGDKFLTFYEIRTVNS